MTFYAGVFVADGRYPDEERAVLLVPRYYRLADPVTLVTAMKGKESFTDSRKLFNRLEEMAESPIPGQMILSIYQGRFFVSEDGVAALETMLRTVGMTPFFRASRLRKGPERATFTRYNWEYVSEYLGWDWHR